MSKPKIHLPEGMTAEEAKEILQEYGATENPTVVSGERIASLQDHVEEAKTIFAELLAEDSPQSPEALARQDMAALAEPFVEAVDRPAVDTLHQDPQTGDGSGAGTSRGVDLHSLSLDERTRIKEVLLPKRRTFRARGVDGGAERIEQDICELVGADSFDDVKADLEAL
jgi:coenzyme F420-reducing hydrogenase alpha subunit